MISPVKTALFFEETKEEALGKELIEKGAVGLLVVAGGQGTRLKFKGPKGMYPIGLNNESLFELIAQKVLKASQKIPVAIMTSPQNDEETKAFFKENNDFGLKKGQLFFFTQKESPFLNDDKTPFLLNGERVLAPNGNGYALHYFYESGLFDLFKEKGVSILSFILIDNALTNPFEEKAIGYHEKFLCDITLKALEKKTSSEKLGTLVLKNNKIEIVEYSDLLEEDISLYPLGNMGEHLFSFSFIEKIKNKTLPIHLAKKEVIPNVFANKQEFFIFDTLPYSEKTSILIYPRGRFFSPLKNATGENSHETVKSDLLKEATFDRIKFL
jgi:UDP-N-acetylglucosamine/UDP-N-acetylgalactosamine diphosphorylase